MAIVIPKPAIICILVRLRAGTRLSCIVGLMSMHRWVLGLVVLCAAGCPRPEPALHLRTEQALFDPGKGYRFAALPEPRASIVWLDVRYPVGFADDPPDKPGLAHLVEHLLFDVELDRDGRKTSVDAELSRLALAHNAITTDDFTMYRTMLDPDKLDEVLRIEGERLGIGCAGLTPEVFVRERAVVVSELRTTRSPDDTKVEQFIRETAYPKGHPYRSSATPESVAKLELSDACAFLAGPYRRGEAIVVASGVVDQAHLARAAHAFDRLPARAPIAKRLLPAAALPPMATRHELHLRAPRLVALWSLPPRDSLAHRMLQIVLPMVTHRINDVHPGYAARSTVIGGAQAPVLALTLTLHAENESFAAMDAVKEAITDLLHSLDSVRTTDAVWKSVWKSQAAFLLADWDSLDRRSYAFADYLQFEQGADYLSERLGELAVVVPPEVAVPAHAVLGNERARFLVLEAGGVRPLKDQAPDGGGQTTDATETTTDAADTHEARVDPATADQPLPIPTLRPARRAERLRLANGLSVVLWPYGGTPLVRGTLVVNSGWVNDPLGLEGMAQLVSNDAMADHLVINAQPSLVSRSDVLIHSLEWPLQAQLTLRTGAKQRIHEQLLRSQAVAKFDLEQRVALYGEKHAYARSGMTDATLESIGDADMLHWTHRHLVTSNATLIVTGQFDVDQVKKDLQSPAPLREIGSDRGSRDVIDQAHPRQAWISSKLNGPNPSLELQVAFVGGRGIDEDHAKRLVLEEVLFEQLFELRKRTALSYITQASYEPRRAGGLWSLTIVVDSARAAEAGKALAQMLDQLRRDPESYRAAFVLARQKVLERLLASSGSSRQVLAQLIELVRFDLEDARHDHLPAEVAALTLTTFHPFVAHELAETGQVFGAIGDAAAVDAAIEAAKHASNAGQNVPSSASSSTGRDDRLADQASSQTAR
ncbi:MAG TPA: insulinase family protein [Kofleriaceae bacterium]|jgi:zinc protease|nr:insulinase family protein [Kofleriaceae bacterium]